MTNNFVSDAAHGNDDFLIAFQLGYNEEKIKIFFFKYQSVFLMTNANYCQQSPVLDEPTWMLYQ